jgi:hypothetical protein
MLPLAASNTSLTQLKFLELCISFICKKGQGNTRPVIGTLMKSGRPKFGALYRPTDPGPLRYVGGDSDGEVGMWCRRRPLSVFRVKVEGVQVRFCGERVEAEHHPGNRCENPGDRCWCIGRRIDEESLRGSGIVGEIGRKLIGGE